MSRSASADLMNRGHRTGKMYDLMVIGAGFAGMAGALFAARAGMRVALAGATGGIDFSTGFIDLMGVHPIAEGRRWDNPWGGIEAVIRDCPEHPYALMERTEIEDALRIFTEFSAEHGLEYTGFPERNAVIATPAGTLKRTYRVPLTAWGGVQALEDRAPTLIVDFHGLKGFSGRQIVETLKDRMPEMRTVRIPFPGGRGELYPEHMSWSMMDAAVQDKLAAAVAEHIGDAQYIGFPAVLGALDPMGVVRRLEELTGRTVFEIPTLPPSIAGTRLRSVFDRGLPPMGVDLFSQKLITGAATAEDGSFEFLVGRSSPPIILRAKRALLASGRFFGKGLKGERSRIIEPVFNLPVVQPMSREKWHCDAFLDPAGHPVNTAGVEVDAGMRPVDGAGTPVHENLHAAGAILAHQDWMRMKCGAGLAVSTAYKAVRAMKQML